MEPTGPPEQFEMESFPREYEGSILPLKVGLVIACTLCLICWGIGLFCFIYGSTIPDETRNELAYDGPEAPRDICKFLLPCRNGGTCIVNDDVESGFNCECNNGWMGMKCNLPCLEEQCGENGICNQTNEDGPDCFCNEGYVIKIKYKDGRVQCAPECNDLQKSVCKAEINGNSCMQGIEAGSFDCTCKAKGYRPDDGTESCISTTKCSTDELARCNQIEHSDNGCIIKRNMKYECVCGNDKFQSGGAQVASEKGESCEVDVCSMLNPCGNGGQCYYPKGRLPYKCICPFGWAGAMCDVACGEDICGKGAVCNVTVICTEKTTGKCRQFRQSNCRCDDPKSVNVYPKTRDGPMACVEDKCHPVSPCSTKNAIRCLPLEIAPFYKCRCKPGFIGASCEVLCDNEVCGDFAKCDHAIPRDVTKGDCKCIEGALEVPGSKDPEEGTIECIPDRCFECSKKTRPGKQTKCPCLNNGRCSANITYPYYNCFCQGWKGDTCEEPCECVKFASCTNRDTLCKCTSGYFAYNSETKPKKKEPPTSCYTKDKMTYNEAKAFCESIGEELKTFPDAEAVKEFFNKEQPYMNKRKPLLIMYQIDEIFLKLSGSEIDVGSNLPDFLASDANFDIINENSLCTSIVGEGRDRGIVNVKCDDPVTQVICKKTERCTGTQCYYLKSIDPPLTFEPNPEKQCDPDDDFTIKNVANLAEIMSFLRGSNSFGVKSKHIFFPIKLKLEIHDADGNVIEFKNVNITGGLRGHCLAGTKTGEPPQAALEVVSCSKPNYYVCTESVKPAGSDEPPPPET